MLHINLVLGKKTSELGRNNMAGRGLGWTPSGLGDYQYKKLKGIV
jgi:hypothetical protein